MVILSTALSSLPSRPKTAVLLVNLGTPTQPTARAVRTYLREFLSDTRVVELPRWLWWGILNMVVLPLRCRKVAKKYQSIWLSSALSEEATKGIAAEQGGEVNNIHGGAPLVTQPLLQGSPLRVYSQVQAEKLQERLQRIDKTITVICAMRYGEPSLSQALQQLSKESIEQVLILPLYPQYSATTTAAVMDVVAQYLTKRRNQPALRTIKHYYQHPAYISAICRHIQAYWCVHGVPNFAAGEKLLLSFHGIPRRCVEQGDPYYQQCMGTAIAVRKALSLTEEHVLLSFQSRFGKERWLEPYTSDVLTQLGSSALSRLDLFCPGFPADCLETLEEIAIEGKHIFTQAGGRGYHFIPCLNVSEGWIDALEAIALENLHGWLQ